MTPVSQHHTMYCIAPSTDLTPIMFYKGVVDGFIYPGTAPNDHHELMQRIASITAARAHAKVADDMFTFELDSGKSVTVKFGLSTSVTHLDITAVYVCDDCDEHINFYKYPKLELICCTPNNFVDVYTMDIPEWAYMTYMMILMAGGHLAGTSHSSEADFAPAI